jgi:hypothetical protein
MSDQQSPLITQQSERVAAGRLWWVGLRWFDIRLPNLAELGKVADWVRNAGLTLEEREAGLFVRDPSRNGVMLTTRETP